MYFKRYLKKKWSLLHKKRRKKRKEKKKKKHLNSPTPKRLDSYEAVVSTSTRTVNLLTLKLAVAPAIVTVRGVALSVAGWPPWLAYIAGVPPTGLTCHGGSGKDGGCSRPHTGPWPHPGITHQT